jgi:hypothetical protein
MEYHTVRFEAVYDIRAGAAFTVRCRPYKATLAGAPAGAAQVGTKDFKSLARALTWFSAMATDAEIARFLRSGEVVKVRRRRRRPASCG